MDAYETILTKRDTREFLPDPVDDGTLRQVLQAGRMAGSAKNSQLNRVVVVTDQAQRERLSCCGNFTSWLPSAPVVLAIVIPTEGGRMVDVGRMAQNMMLAAQASGLASCPMSFQDQPCVRRVLGLPDELEAPVGVAVGKPAPAQAERKSSPHSPRRPRQMGAMVKLTTGRRGGRPGSAACPERDSNPHALASSAF